MQSLTEIAEDPSGEEIIYYVKLASFIALIVRNFPGMPDFFWRLMANSPRLSYSETYFVYTSASWQLSRWGYSSPFKGYTANSVS